MAHDQGAAETRQDEAATGAGESTSAVGTLLRASRVRVGEDLRDVARMLRIRYPYLEAIEEGRYADLPGAAYAVGFVRGYAEHLGLDSEEIVRRFKAETSAAARKTELVFPSPVTETVMPGGAIIFIGVVLAGLAYGVWYMGTSDDSPFASIIGPIPERLSEVLNSPANGTAEEKAAQAPVADPQPAAPNVPGASGSEPTTQTAVTEPTPTPDGTVEEEAAASADPVAVSVPSAADASTEVATQTAEAIEVAASTTAEAVEPVAEQAAEQVNQAVEKVVQAAVSDDAATQEPTTQAIAQVSDQATPVPQETNIATQAAQASSTPTPSTIPSSVSTETASAAPATEPEATGPKIEVRAKAASWIQVRDGVAQALIMTRLLREGDVYTVPNRSGLVLVTGNAGALEILVDGEAVPAIGGAGAVRRSVALDAEKLKAGTAVAN